MFQCNLLHNYFTIKNNSLNHYEAEYLGLFDNDIDKLVSINGRKFNLLHFICHFYYTKLFSLDFVQTVINNIEDINAKDGHSESALYIACYLNHNNHKELLIKLLLKNGADPYMLTKHMKPFIMDLITYEMHESLDVILSCSFNINLAFATAHLDACELVCSLSVPSAHIIDKFISNGLNISRINHGNTFLHILLQEYGLFTKLQASNKLQKLKDIILLIANKYLHFIDINAQNDHGKTILHLAIISDMKPLIKILLKHNELDVNLKDNIGQSALHYCCKMSKIKYVKKLLQLTQKVDSTALSIALHNYLLAENKLHKKILQLFTETSYSYYMMLIDYLEKMNHPRTILFYKSNVVNDICIQCNNECKVFCGYNSICQCCYLLNEVTIKIELI